MFCLKQLLSGASLAKLQSNMNQNRIWLKKN
jgi:hypothetical protein